VISSARVATRRLRLLDELRDPLGQLYAAPLNPDEYEVGRPVASSVTSTAIRCNARDIARRLR